MAAVDAVAMATTLMTRKETYASSSGGAGRTPSIAGATLAFGFKRRVSYDGKRSNLTTSEGSEGTELGDQETGTAQLPADVDYVAERERELSKRKSRFSRRSMSRAQGLDKRLRKGQSLEEISDARKVIQARESMTGGIIDPRISTFMQYWDMLMLTFLLFCALFTPYEVVFLDGGKIDSLFIVNRVVDLGFMIDMVIHFRLAYQESAERGGVWVFDKRAIRRHYLAAWFWIDLVSVLPIYIIGFVLPDGSDATLAAPPPPSAPGALGAALGDDVASGAAAQDLIGIIRVVRLLRLLKIMRVLKVRAF